MYLLPSEVLFWRAAISLVLCVIVVAIGFVVSRRTEKPNVRFFVLLLCWLVAWKLALAVDRHAISGFPLHELFGEWTLSLPFALICAALLLAALYLRRRIIARGLETSRLVWSVALVGPALICALYMIDISEHQRRAPDDMASIATLNALQRVASGDTVDLPPRAHGWSDPARKSINESLELRRVFCDIEGTPALFPFERIDYTPRPRLTDGIVPDREGRSANAISTTLLTGYEGCWFMIDAAFTQDATGNMTITMFRLREPTATREKSVRGYRSFLAPQRESALFKRLD